MSNLYETDYSAPPYRCRGRPPKQRLPLPHERPRRLALPFDAGNAKPTPEHQTAFLRFLQWIVCAEDERNPESRRQAFDEALRALNASGLQARDLLEAIR